MQAGEIGSLMVAQWDVGEPNTVSPWKKEEEEITEEILCDGGERWCRRWYMMGWFAASERKRDERCG